MQIKDVAAQVGLSIEAIRYYEKEGLIVPVARDEAGRRQFTRANIDQILFIRHMREAGLGIDVLRQYIALIEQDELATIPQRRELLANEAQQLQVRIKELTQALNLLNLKVAHYDEHRCKNETAYRPNA
ncbi:MAG TPA: MerR family transcriptional regulator [Lactobacillaceae bacterium]|jgi:DNA-binding transcriptional MerR regulator